MALWKDFHSLNSIVFYGFFRPFRKQIIRCGLTQPKQVAQMSRYGGAHMPSVRYSIWILIWIKFA